MVFSSLVDLSHVATEQKDPGASMLEKLSLAEQCDAVFEGMVYATQIVKANKGVILAAVEKMIDHWKHVPIAKRRICLVGAGTSGRLAVITAFKMRSCSHFHVTYDIAGGLTAFYTAVEGAEDAGVTHQNIDQDAVVICLSASGRTPYALSYLEAAKKTGALTLAIHNSPNSALAQAADVDLCNSTGAEYPRGSTRMKAGTSQYVTLQVLMSLLSESETTFEDWFEALDEATQAVDKKALGQNAQALCAHFQGSSSEEGRLVYVGEGVGGLLGVVDGAELQPTYSWSRVAYQVPDLSIVSQRDVSPAVLSPHDFVLGIGEGVLGANIILQSEHDSVTNMLLKTLTTVFALQSGWIMDGEMIHLDPRNMTKKLIARRVQILKNLRVVDTDEEALVLLKLAENDLVLALQGGFPPR